MSNYIKGILNHKSTNAQYLHTLKTIQLTRMGKHGIKDHMGKTIVQKQQKDKINGILSQIPIHLYWYDLNNTFQGCNLIQAQSLGLTSTEEIVGKHLNHFMPEPEWNSIARNNKKVIDNKKTYIFEELHTNKEGKPRLYLSHKTPLKNEENQVIGVLGVSQDISSIKKKIDLSLLRTHPKNNTTHIANYDPFYFLDTENIASISDYITNIRDYYENIIAIMPGHVYWQDNAGMLLGCNDNQATTLGLSSRQDIFGKKINDFLPKDEANTHNETFNRILKTKESVVLEEISTDKDGNKKYYFTQKRPILDKNGKTLGLLGCSLDITERKRAELEVIKARERAEIASQAKSEFLMNMSHDLRTPCSGIVGLAKILSDEETDPKKKAQLQHIVQSSECLLNLLSEILDYTKVEDGGYKILNHNFNLRKLISSIHDLLSSEIEFKKLTTHIHYPETLPTNIITDSVALHRILLNLLGNAVKFTESGSITTHISIDTVKPELTISIQDTGIGIEQDKLNIIFDRFSRLSPAYDGKHHGTGLGLSTVSRLLSELGATITVSSQINIGSNFTIKVPIQLSSTPPRSQPRNTVIQKTKHLDFCNNPGLKVLVVEDDFISKQVSKTLFESFSAEVTWVGTANEALCCDLSQFDFILTDIGLPDINGFELARKIRQWEKNHQINNPCLIIGLTAHINPSYLSKMQQHGMSDLVQKPLTREHVEQF